MLNRSLSIVTLFIPLLAALAADAQQPSPSERWERSDRALATVPRLATPIQVSWTPDGVVWYVSEDRTAIRVIDPATGRETTAFDAGEVEGEDTIDEVTPLPGGNRLVATAGETPFVVDLAEGSVTAADSAVLAKVERSRPRPVRPGLFSHTPPIREVLSPDGIRLAGTSEGNLYVRSVETGDTRWLSDDGTQEVGWDVEGARWDPAGRRIAVHRIDRRGVPTVPIVDWLAEGEPVRRVEYSRVGEPIPRHEIHVVDTETGENVALDLDDVDAPYRHVAGWSPDGSEVYLLRTTRFTDRLDLVAADASIGESRIVLTETTDTFIGGLPFLHGNSGALEAAAWVRFRPDGEGFVWTSSRDGHRRLYLYEMDGTLVRPLTPAGWESGLEVIDEGHGRIWFTAAADPDGAPGHRALYHAPLAGGDPVKVVDGPHLAATSFAPDREHVVVEREGLDRPAALDLYSDDAAHVTTIWKLDPAVLTDLGWIPPEPVVVKAADGTTDLHGHLFRPAGFDSSASYPVLELIYAAPQSATVLPAVRHPYNQMAPLWSQLGFAVVLFDARGTPSRGKAFQDVVHGAVGGHEITDHAAGLRQLAAERPWMDLDRVGIFGHSWGGYFALRGMLTEPDLYHAGWSSAPAVDLEDFRVSIEPYMGCLPETCPEAYEGGSNARLADRLEGDLALVHGTSDDDVPFAETMKMADALIEADKPFDLLVLPGAHHIPFAKPYYWQAARRHLVEALDAPAGPRSSSEPR